MYPKIKKQLGFTLIEILVAITSSTIILGGFLIAFSSLEQTSRLHDDELRNLSEGVSVRMTIEKALTGASNVVFANVSNNSLGTDVDMLYYYKYDDNNLLTEYGYFYIDEQRIDVDPSFQERFDGAGTDITVNHLFFEKVDVAPTDPAASAANPPDPANFDLKSPNRQIVAHDTTNFSVNLARVDTDQGDKRVAYNVDYQITTSYFSSSGGEDNRRERVFKGSSYALGKITG